MMERKRLMIQCIVASLSLYTVYNISVLYNSSVVSPYVDETVFRLLHVCWAVIAIAQYVISTTISKTNVIYDAVFACMVVYRFMRLYPIGAIVYMIYFLCLQESAIVLRQNQYMCPIFGGIVLYIGFKKEFSFSQLSSIVYLLSGIMTYLFFLFSQSFKRYGLFSLLCTSFGYISFSLMSTYELALIPYPIDIPISLLSVVFYTYTLKVARLAYIKIYTPSKIQILCFPTFISSCLLSLMGIYECLACVWKVLDPYPLRYQSIYFYLSYLLFDSFSRRRESSFYSLDGFVHHVATGAFAVYSLWTGNVSGMSSSFIAEVSTIVLTMKKILPQHRRALSRVFPYFFLAFRVILLIFMYICLSHQNRKTREYPDAVMNTFLSALVVFTIANMCWFRLILNL